MSQSTNLETEIWEWSEDASALSKPENWLTKARSFHYTIDYFMKEYMASLAKGGLPTGNRDYLFKTYEPFLFMLATTIELYLKGYLIVKGEKVRSVISFGHNLKDLRVKCSSFGTQKFDTISSLKTVTDDYGRVILESGGLRYPGRKPPPALFPDYILILDRLDDVLDEEMKGH